MKRLLQERKGRLLSQIRNISDALLMAITGYVMAYLYSVFSVPHFYHLFYNFLILFIYHFVLRKKLTQKKWVLLAVLFSLHIPLYFLVSYSNYIYTLFILLFYLIYYIITVAKGLWPLWLIYTVSLVWFYLAPGSLFFIIRGYNLIVTGNWFFLQL